MSTYTKQSRRDYVREGFCPTLVSTSIFLGLDVGILGLIALDLSLCLSFYMYLLFCSRFHWY